MALPKITPEFELPNLCGAKAGFNDIQKQLTASLDNLNLNIELPATDIVDKAKEDLKAAIGELDKLKMPELPSLPDVSLSAELTSLANIATDSVSGLAQFTAKKLELDASFGSALAGIGKDFNTLVSDVKGGIPSCDCSPNMIIPAAGGTAQEKPANTITADEAPSGEAPAKPEDNKADVSASFASLTSQASSFLGAASTFIGKMATGETASEGLRITPEQRLNASKADARLSIQSILGGVAARPGNFLQALNGASLNSLETAANTSGDGLNLSDEEVFRNSNARSIIKLHADATAKLNILSAMLKASVSPFPHNQAVDPETGIADGKFIYVRTSDTFPSEADENGVKIIPEVSWDAIWNKREELQTFIDKAKVFHSNDVFNEGLEYDIKPLQQDSEKVIKETDTLIKIFKEKFINANNEGKMTGETIST
jgi:hypothetical protein